MDQIRSDKAPSSLAVSESPSSKNPDCGAGRRVIVNGDDFGYSPEVNQAIIQAHREGILTSASLMVTADSCQEAVELARENPTLGVGLHLVLVCGRAAAPREQIPDLVNQTGDFPYGPVRSGLRYQFNSSARRQLKTEIRAQLERFAGTGLPLSHVDGHLHMHSHPVIFEALIDLAREFGIRTIRLPREELQFTLNLSRSNLFNKYLWSWIFGRLGRYGARKLDAAKIAYADRVYGLLSSGLVDEGYLLGLIPQIKASVVEIYAHPSIGDDHSPGQMELNALLSHRVRDALDACGFRLTNYNSTEVYASR